MRQQHTVVRRIRRIRRSVTAALGALLVVAAALVPTSAAQAMRQVGPSPTVQPGGTVVVTVQNQQAGTGSWTITAPPGTTITAAVSRPGTGLGQFTCTPTGGGSAADCGSTTWGPRNEVDVTLAVDPTATPGTTTGTSGIAPFEAPAPYSVTVVAAPVPAELRLVQSGAQRLLAGFPAVRTVTLSNTGDGEARDVTLAVRSDGLQLPRCELDGVATACGAVGTGLQLGTLAPGAQRVLRLTVAVPGGTAPGTARTLTASAASTSASASPVTSSALLTTRAPSAPVVTAPTGTTTDRTPEVRGLGAIDRATVTVRQGSAVLCTAVADVGGAWACTPTRALTPGPVELTAAQTYGGVESARAPVRFSVASAPRPGGTAPVPGVGSGPADGRPGTAPVPAGGSAGAGTAAGNGGSDAGPTGSSAAPPATDGRTGSGATDTGGSTTGGATTGGSGADGDGDGADGPADGSGSGDGAGSGGALPMDLRLSAQRIVPGTAADMRGTLGPNASGATVVITFSGRMSPGMVYRDVHVAVDGAVLPCTVGTTTFSCTVPLDPGQRADVTVRVYADAVNAPDTAVQQLAVASNRQAQANAVTVTTAVAKGTTEAAALADQITTFTVTEFPGAMVPLLAMILFALAAAVATRRPTDGDATDASSASGPAPTDPPAEPGSTR